MSLTLLFFTLLSKFGNNWKIRRVRQRGGRRKSGWFEVARRRKENALCLGLLVRSANMHLKAKSAKLLVDQVRADLDVTS